MIYTEYLANVQADKLDEYNSLMEEFKVLAEKHGVIFIGAWRTAVGQREEITILEAYKDMADFERIRKEIVADPALRENVAKLTKIRTVRSRLLQPVSYSPLQ